MGLAFLENCGIISHVLNGGLAQLVRAPASHAGGHWFESSSLHHLIWNSFPLRRCVNRYMGKLFLKLNCVRKAVTNWYPFHLPNYRCDIRYGSPRASLVHPQAIRWHPFQIASGRPKTMAGWSRRRDSATKYFQFAMVA